MLGGSYADVQVASHGGPSSGERARHHEYKKAPVMMTGAVGDLSWDGYRAAKNALLRLTNFFLLLCASEIQTARMF